MDKEKSLEELEKEAERGLTEWLNKPNPLSAARNKLWFPLQDYKDVGSFMNFNKGKKKKKLTTAQVLDFRTPGNKFNPY